MVGEIRDACPALPQPQEKWLTQPSPENFQDCPAPPRKCPEFDCYPAPPWGFYSLPWSCFLLVSLLLYIISTLGSCYTIIFYRCCLSVSCVGITGIYERPAQFSFPFETFCLPTFSPSNSLQSSSSGSLFWQRGRQGKDKKGHIWVTSKILISFQDILPAFFPLHISTPMS